MFRFYMQTCVYVEIYLYIDMKKKIYFQQGTMESCLLSSQKCPRNVGSSLDPVNCLKQTFFAPHFGVKIKLIPGEIKCMGFRQQKFKGKGGCGLKLTASNPKTPGKKLASTQHSGELLGFRQRLFSLWRVARSF